jgi:serine/threonine-protein kinase RsbW
VLLVRQALRGLADMVALDAIELNDISTALSEACNNVVAHAYPGGTGPMHVEMKGSEDGLELLIRDRGCGLKPHASEPSEIGGIGIPVMLALADSVEFAGTDGEGTDVRMRFATPKAALLAGKASSQDSAEEVLIGADGDQDGVYLAVGPPALASSVLARVLAAIAARAHLSTERIATTRPLAEQIVDHLANGDEVWHLALAATVAPRQLDLRIVSLPAGSSLGELPPALEELTECHRVSRTGSVEVLSLRLHESRPATGKQKNNGMPGDHGEPRRHTA